MVDAVLGLGYGRSGMYSGHVFIPRLADDQSTYDKWLSRGHG